MNWFLEKANIFTVKYFHKIYGFAAASLLLVVGLLLFYKIIPEGKLRFLWYAWGIIGLELPLLFFWLIYTFRLPKNNKKNIGVVLCIYADSEEAEQVLKKDFITSIKKQFQSSEIGEIYNVIVIKNHLASKYSDFNAIKKLHKKVKGNIYIFGETKKRKHGVEQYFLSLDGYVLHRPVAKQVSQELSKDFLATLPKAINFKDEFAFAGFQVSADIVVNSVEYIIGIAAFISGNPFLATKLHTELKERILLSKQKLPGNGIILSKINNLLSDEFAIIAAYYLGKCNREKAYENLKTSLDLNPNCYRALITESVISFSWEKDPKKALALTKRCHMVSEPTWRYNEAFLHFWLEQYASAWKQCEKIKKQNYSNEFEISREVTQFNEELLKIVIDKPVLYFWIGFNYYYKQINLPLALKNFEVFIEQADPSMEMLSQKASSWLIEIKKEGSWK